MPDTAQPFENNRNFDASIMIQSDRQAEEPQVVFRPCGEVISCNQSWHQLFGVAGPNFATNHARSLSGQDDKREGYPPRNVFDRLDAPTTEKLRQTIKRLINGPVMSLSEFKHSSLHGQVSWFTWSMRFDAEKNCIFANGVDIGQRRRQHEIFESITQLVSQRSGKALFESVATELATTFQLARVGISKVDGADFQTIAFADQEGKRTDVRYPIKGTICEVILNWGSVRLSVNPVEEAPKVWGLQSGATIAYVGCPIFSLDRSRKIGLIWVASYSPIEDLALIEWLLLSFSVRVAAEIERVTKEEELERQLAYNQAILRASPDLLFEVSEDFVYTDFICRSVDQLLVPPENIIGRNMRDLLPEDIFNKFLAANQHSVQTGEVSMITYEMNTLGGLRESFEARILVNRDRTSLQFVRNITAENNLRAEQKRLTSILEASPDICAILNFDGTLSYLNPAGRKFFNWEEGSQLSEHWMSHIKPESSVALFHETCTPTALREGTWRGDVSYRDHAGIEVPFSQLIVAHEAHGDAKGYYSVVLRDVSDRRNFETKIEEQQLQIMSSAKMAALGEMAAGIAHEINNPLASIMARAQVLGEMAHERPLVALERMCEFTDKISQMSERIARIIRSLRFFARDGEMDPVEARPVRELIDETLELCRARFRSQNVRIDVEMESEAMVIWSRPVQISQVLLNLLSNAFDAVTRLDERWVVISAKKSAKGLLLTVTDSGNGIEESIASKIMLPFFTTKEVGAGTGLGLSISSGIVQGHGGELFLDRNSDNTRFVVNLPQAVRN